MSMALLRRTALLLSLALVLTTPGPACWAQVGRVVRAAPAAPVVPGAAPVLLAPAGLAPGALAPSSLPAAVLPAAGLPSPVPSAVPASGAAAAVPPRASAVPAAVTASAARATAEGAASVALQAAPAAAGSEAGRAAPGARAQAGTAARLGRGAAALFDGSRPASPANAAAPEAVDPSSPRGLVPADLKLAPADAEAAAQFTADFHAKVGLLFPDYQFTVRDFYAWAKFVRFFTPSLGVKEALRAGAAYVYGDRLEHEAERASFDRELSAAIGALRLSDPGHGKDAAAAARLTKLAEPAPETLRDDEESPFKMPLAKLVPSKERTALVLTPTTLRRIEAAYRAFAMRDFALLLGPPATEKSAIPKYLAAENGVPYLAVTMHPGIGTFELVGGYRPKVVRIADLAEARRIVSARLAEARRTGDFSDLLETASRVYKGGLEEAVAAADKDLADGSPEAERRVKTLAHGLEYGAASLVWQDGFLTYALKRDIWISFEEINAAPTESQEFLNDFMRTRRLVITQKLGQTETLEPRPGGRFMLWATMNPETDPNREVLSQTLKNRWRVKHFGDLPAFEQAEIIEKKYGLPTNWSIALVENFHKELRRQARDRVIGDAWRDGYEVNLRHMMRVAKRWKRFVEAETAAGRAPDEKRRLFLLAREAYSVYGGMMRQANERAGAFVLLDQALKLSAVGVRSPDDLTVRPDRIEDLGDRVRIGDVELEKGPGGPRVPRPNPDYLADAGAYARLYEYAKALAMGEPLLVMGDSAAGKTTDLEYLFFRLNRNLRYKNLDTDTAIEEVIGGYTTGKRRGQFVFQEGLLPAAMEEGSGAFLDEFNLNPLVEWLNTVIDDGQLYLPERIVEGHPMLVAAANPPDPRYPGRILLSPATRSRYTEIWVDRDDSVARLKRLMGHWLAGGTQYAALLLPAAALLSQLAGLFVPGMAAFGRGAAPKGVVIVPGRSRGEFDPGINWGTVLLVISTLGFFAGAAAGGVSGVIGLPMLLAPLVALGLQARHSALKREMPLASANARYLKEQATRISLRRMGTMGAFLRITPVGTASDRRQAIQQALGTLSSVDSEAIAYLADLAVAETSEQNIQDIAKGLNRVGGKDAEAALESILARLERASPVYTDVAVQLDLLRRRPPAAEEPEERTLADLASPKAAPAAPPAERAAAALARLGDSLPDQLRAAALREAMAAAEGGDPVAVRRLETLLAESRPSGLAAFGGAVVDGLKRFFGLKKKSAEDDAPAGPPTLEEVFKARSIPDGEQEALRAKVKRVETLMRMVGGSVGRDTKLKWAPGDLWAYFPESNTATYPVDTLVTHTEEELVGVIDHEALHRETTVLDERLPLTRKYMEDPLKHFLWNGLEDPRVNSRGIHRLPGAERYLHALYDRYIPREAVGFKDPKVEAPDLSELGDGATAFDPKVLQFPHVEFVMAANYWWRHGVKPKFVNATAERAFDAALPHLPAIFGNYPKDADPPKAEAAAATTAALKDIDEKILPLYEPLVVESQKKLSKMMKGKKKGQGKGGGSGGAPQPDPSGKSKPKPSDKKDGKAGEKPQDGSSEEGGGEPDAKDQREARRRLEDMARRAADELKGQMKDSPKKKDVQEARDKAAKDKKTPAGQGASSGTAEATPLSIEEIARTQREQILNRVATPYQNAYQPVAHLAGPMVTHLENVFLKNSRPRDEGYYRTGKRPDMKRVMKREGEGSVRDDVMLRRRQATKRRYKVTLLVDESGSMDAFRREAVQTVVLFVDALSRLQIDVEVIGFSEAARVHKAFAEPLTQAAKDKLVAELQEHLGNGGTHDADALKLAVERIAREDADQRYVFVVTDGQGNGPSSLTSVFPLAEKAGVQVLGVGVGDGMAYVRTAYPRHAVVPDIAQLPKTVKDRLVEGITRAEHAVRGAAHAFLPGVGAGAGMSAFGGKSLPRFFVPMAAFAAAWALGVLVAVPALAALAPAALQPLPAAVMLGSLLVFVPLKRWFPDAGGVGFVTVVAGLLSAAPIPLVAKAGLAVLLGVFFASDRGASVAGILTRARPAGGADTALLAFFAAAAWFPVYSWGLVQLPLLAIPFAAAAVVAGLMGLWFKTGRPEEGILLAYLSAGVFALDLLGQSWVPGAVLGTVLGFKGLYGAFKNRQLKAAAREEALSNAAARAAEAARETAELDKAAKAEAVPAAALEARAAAALAGLGSSLADRLRRTALDEALAGYRARPDAVTARRLEALLEEGKAAGAGAFGLLLAPGKAGWLAAAGLAAYLGLQASLAVLGLPFGWALAAHLVLSGFWMWRAWGWRDGSPLPLMLFMNGMLPVVSSVSILSLSWLIPWWASFFAASGTALFLVNARLRAKLLPLRLQAKVLSAAPKGSALAGRAEDRWAALRKLRADAPLYAGSAEVERLFPAVELLADSDPYKQIREEAVGVLAGFLPRPAARAALERVSKPKSHPDTAWKASSALIEEKMARVEAAQAEQARAAAARKAADSVGERGEAALAAVDRTTLSGRLRAAALEEALSAWRASSGDGRRVAARRLEDLLADSAASGSAAFGASFLRSLEKALFRPVPLIAGAGLLFHSAVFAAVSALPQVFVPLGGFMGIGFFAFLILGKTRTTALAAFACLSGAMAVAGHNMHVWFLPYGAVAALIVLIAFQLVLKRSDFFGLLKREAAAKVRAARPAGLDPLQDAWASDLALRSGRRRAALEAMRRDPARARALRPVLEALFGQGDSADDAGVVSAVAAQGDEGALAALDGFSGWHFTKDGTPTPGARAAKAAAEDLRAALAAAAELAALAQAAEAARQRAESEPHAGLAARARAALAALGTGLADRLRRSSIEEALRELETAPDAGAAAVAARRLRERLEEGGASGMAAARAPLFALPEGFRGRPDRFPVPWTRRASMLARWQNGPLILMQASWMLAAGAALFIGIEAIFIMAALFGAGLVWMLAGVVWPRSAGWHVGPSDEMAGAAFRAWEAVAPSQKAFAARLGALHPRSRGLFTSRKPWPVKVDHPFLYLVHPYAEVRRSAYEASGDLLRREAAVIAPLVAAGLRARAGLPRTGELADDSADYALLLRLGGPGLHELGTLEGLPDDTKAALAALRETAALAAETKPAPTADRLGSALAEARGRTSLPAAGLPAQLANKALTEAAAAAERAPQDGVALRRLEELLKSAPRGANGVQAAADEPWRRPEFRRALADAFAAAFKGKVEGWSRPYVEKPAFPFVVDKQRRLWQPKATEQTRANRSRVAPFLKDPAFLARVLGAAERALEPSWPERHPEDSLVQGMARLLAPMADDHGLYEDRGTLVLVGWGSGDHETAGGMVPVGPKTLGGRLASRTVEALARLMPGTMPAPSALPAPAAPDRVEDALSAARALPPPATLPGQLAARAVQDAAAALEAARAAGDADAEAVALRRLEDLLRAAPGPAAGVRSRAAELEAAAGGHGVRPAAWGAFLAAGLSAALSLGALAAALWTLAPAAAAAAGAAGAAGAARLMTRPVPVSSREVAHAPRARDAVPSEFLPAVDALAELSGRLGLPVGPGAALLTPEDPARRFGGWTAMALGPDAAPSSTVAVGEAWLGAGRAALLGVLAHELAHLAFGDNRRLEGWKRAALLAAGSWWGGLAAAFLLGHGAWLVPAAAGALLLATALAAAAMMRRMERRADAFAAHLAGPAAARAFLGRVAEAAPEDGRGPFASHPAPAARLRAIP